VGWSWRSHDRMEAHLSCSYKFLLKTKSVAFGVLDAESSCQFRCAKTSLAHCLQCNSIGMLRRLSQSRPSRLLRRNLLPLLLLGELCLCVLIVRFINYTEIDWQAYMDEVGGFLDGERDYLNLKGDTGPLVYPAGYALRCNHPRHLICVMICNVLPE